ncbi:MULTISPECIES: TRAP transporter large permease [unclassified Sporosarcina]|uniref:TRAP transporter large permease n=1 Tax=unclassified Sporosarcina TaxID=2647733 RepID=UPI00203DCDA0|nr:MULTISPECIES: TRAP transporter large permease [unclassified Sporosarcina]GKV65224.1 C4-dicarboxylate ABC transporter permease [Sporosarcina sp. NCCP-2331]GLB55348.1 C4-dicarboxylate ABC transporter permease [Sporosarcina sp. NCCP-2378]
MTIEILYIVVFALLLILLFSGMYIHSILLTVGIVGLVLLEGPGYINGFLQSDPFLRTASYSLTTVPLFVIMAQFIVRAGVVEDLYSIVYNVSKGRSSILGVLTILAGGLMGAVSGSSNASAGAMGQVAVPQLLKRGYGEGIAGATVAVAGSLSAVIPPSIILILWGVATETPIGQLFIASIVPGLIMMVIIIIVMLIFLKTSNEKNPQSDFEKPFEKEHVSLSRAISALVLTLSIVFIVFYGIFAGIFTPSEAGAIGALASFIAALILKRVNIKFLTDSFADTVKLTSMILMIMITAQIFGRFVSISLLPRKIIGLLSSLIEHPTLVLIVLFTIYFILFMVIEGAAVIIMTAPIVLPLIIEMGTDKIWFGVIVGILCTLGLLTPPVGLSVYSVAGVTGISSEKIFRYALPYALVIGIVIIGLLIVFPGIATILPNMM